MLKHTQVICFCILAACGYGVVHDQITVRLCLEYFSVAHPPWFQTASPTLLALCWGVSATAGIGAALGVVLASVSQSGDPAPTPIPRLARFILLLLLVMAASALSLGVAGYQLSKNGFVGATRMGSHLNNQQLILAAEWLAANDGSTLTYRISGRMPRVQQN